MYSVMKIISHYKWAIYLTIISVVMTMLLIGAAFRRYVSVTKSDGEVQLYDKYYAMIVDNPDSDFTRAIYEGAREEAQKNNACVDLFGYNFSDNYTKYNLMEMAVNSGVDGIIVESDNTFSMTNLINEAADAGIPVITLYNDSPNSRRVSYVGLANYEMGREYGKRILALAGNEHKEVAVLVKSDSGDAGQNIVWSGIQETVNQGRKEGMDVSLSMIAIDDSNEFTVEESIRNIFMKENIPDVFVCLDEVNTTCVYQAVVDYNKVGTVDILGYYNSETILKGIFRSVINISVSVNAEQMGKYCVEALTEYHQIGNANEYYVADVTVIDKYNVKDYMGGEDEE